VSVLSLFIPPLLPPPFPYPFTFLPPLHPLTSPTTPAEATSLLLHAKAREVLGPLLAGTSVWWQDPGVFHSTIYHASNMNVSGLHATLHAMQERKSHEMPAVVLNL
jgi:hypothetical protein